MKAAQIALIAQLVEHLLVTEVRGESPAVHGGDESGNDATIAGIKPSDSVSMGEHNGQKLAVGLGSARTTKATTPFPRGRLRGRGDTADKKRPSLDCACPPWHEGQTGRWHGPCPDAGKPATGSIPAVSPRRTGCTVQADTASERTPNTPHPSRGRRIAHTPGIASPDLVRQARSCQRGCGTGPLSHAGILALQGGEDVNPPGRTVLPDRVVYLHTVSEQSTTPPVCGAIPRVEYQESHYRFLWAVRPPTVMVGLIHAGRIAMHDADFFPPETNVILTSTVSDGKLAQYSFGDELRIIRAIQPKWVLPFDFPVYGDMDPDRRESHIEQVAAGTRDMAYILGNLTDDEVQRVCDVKDLPHDLVEPVQNTTVLPLLKGTTPEEREKLVTEADQPAAPVLAKYGAQYMTVGGSGNYPALVEDLEAINDETDGHPLLVVGLLSPDGRYSLEGVPDNVVAAAGMNQWLKRVEPNSSTPDEMRDAFEDLYTRVAETLDVPNTYYPSIAAATPDDPPVEFQSSPGNSVGKDLSPSYTGAAGDSDYGFGQRKRPTDATDAATAGRKGGQQSPDASEAVNGGDD